MTIRNVGVVMVMTIMIPRSASNLYKKLWTAMGIVSSMVKVSSENRLITRPRGVVSKNIIGQRRTFMSNLLCSVLAAKTTPIARTTALTSTRKACTPPLPV